MQVLMASSGTEDVRPLLVFSKQNLLLLLLLHAVHQEQSVCVKTQSELRAHHFNIFILKRFFKGLTHFLSLMYLKHRKFRHYCDVKKK